MISKVLILAGLLCLSACVIVLVMLAPDRLTRVKPGMSADQVEAIMGRPASIEQSETADQTVSGEVDHYPARFPARSGDCRVIFVNRLVFKTEFNP
jgi:hypothetical protein